MTPFITPFSAEGNAASSYDLSALTSPGGAWTDRQGFTGADWIYFSSSAFTNPRQKKDGNSQLAITVSGSSTGNNTLKSVAWNANDEINATPSGSNSPLCTVLNGSVGDFVQFSSIIADQNTRFLHWRGANNGCGPVGTYQVTAVLGDASASMTPFNVASGNAGFGIQFAAAAFPAVPTTLTVKIACTASPSGAHGSFLFNQLLWLEVPVAAPVPRGAKRYFLGRSLGGGLA